MPYILRLFLPVVLFGLLGIQQVHAIDGDYGNPYATATPGGEGNTVIYDGTLNYGRKQAKLPLITMLGSAFLVMGVVISGIIYNREKNRSLQSN